MKDKRRKFKACKKGGVIKEEYVKAMWCAKPT